MSMAWNKDTSLIGAITKFIFLPFPLSIPITHPYILHPSDIVVFQSDNIGNWETGFIFNWFLNFENCWKYKNLKDIKIRVQKIWLPTSPYRLKISWCFSLFGSKICNTITPFYKDIYLVVPWLYAVFCSVSLKS